MIDAHCHLNDPKFADVEIEFEINKAKQQGVAGFICNGYDLPSSKKALNIAEKYNGVWATVGIHPEHAAATQLPDSDLAEKLIEIANHSKVVAIGESGLDSPDPAQIELFDFHIQLAKKTNLPLVVHCRNAFAEVYQRIGSDPIRVQMHCFTGNWEWAKKFLDLGCYLSFGGIVTYKNGDSIREVVPQVPADRLLIETDSPYLAPEPLRGQRNSPANLKYVAQRIAEIRHITTPELDQLTTRNTYSLFPKMNLSTR